MSNHPREFTHPIHAIEEAEIQLRFQLATNGVVCITDADEHPVILTSAGRFHQ